MKKPTRNDVYRRRMGRLVVTALAATLVLSACHPTQAFSASSSNAKSPFQAPSASRLAAATRTKLMMMNMDDKSNRRGLLGKRGINAIRKWGSGLRTSSRSSNDDGTRTNRLRLVPLSMSKDDNNNEEEESKKFSLVELKSKVTSKIPPKLVDLYDVIMAKLAEVFPSVRVAVLSFVTGAVLMLAAILVPVYSEVETLTEPVTLFETILGDLDRGYVDKVDTQKLFETGVNAMLRTLDPYTEFEPKQQAVALTESIGGKYGGVGLVISGAGPTEIEAIDQLEQEQKDTSTPNTGSKLLPQDALDDQERLGDGDMSSSSSSSRTDEDEDDLYEEDDLDGGGSLQERLEQKRAIEKAKNRGIRVVSAFEGYAFDYGMRVGDKLVAIDGEPITPKSSVDDVRNMLRGEPDTTVEISFEREGVKGVNTISMPRTIVQIRDVKLATLLGNPKDGMGYIQLTGFAANSGKEVRQAILGLQRAAEEASNGERSLQGLILDLRGNPGGLLTSAVDVSSLLVPKGSDIVSARGRGFPGVLYRSRVDPILDPQETKLAVLVNGGTASAAEIVSGAVQDLDVGIIVGSDRTFGKGLVQNVEDLPFDTALKFTVAKYYTPSGRCIQGINYKEGGGKQARYQAKKVADKDKETFYTKGGREVRDGGGIEADYKVPTPKASALEVTLLRSGVFSDFAAQWSRTHQLDNHFSVDEETYKEFQNFVSQKQKDGDLKLESLYNGPLNALKDALKKSGYRGSTKELKQLQASIVQEVRKDFERYRNDIKEDISQSILARYLPESMLIERGLKNDKQVNAAIKVLSNQGKFNQLLARNQNSLPGRIATASSASPSRSSSINTAAAIQDDTSNSARVKLNW